MACTNIFNLGALIHKRGQPMWVARVPTGGLMSQVWRTMFLPSRFHKTWWREWRLSFLKSLQGNEIETNLVHSRTYFFILSPPLWKPKRNEIETNLVHSILAPGIGFRSTPLLIHGLRGCLLRSMRIQAALMQCCHLCPQPSPSGYSRVGQVPIIPWSGRILSSH